MLETLAAQDSAQSLGVIAAAAHLSPSQAHRYLASLVAAGMARQGAETGLYELGPQARQLGVHGLRRSTALIHGRAELEHFVKETGATVLIAALGPRGPVVVRLLMGWPAIRTSLVSGSSLPLLRSATGQIFLAFRPEHETRPIADREIAGDRGLAPVDVDELRRQVRATGIAAVTGTVIPGLRAVTAPIFDGTGQAELAATALVTDDRTTWRDTQIRRRLEQACEAVTQAIGGRRPSLDLGR